MQIVMEDVMLNLYNEILKDLYNILENLGDISIELIGSGLTLIIAVLWQRGIIPFFENLIYKGIRVEGNWTISQSNVTADGSGISIERTTVIEIKQKANKLSGTATSIQTKENNTKDCIFYTVEGEVKDRFVTLFLKCRKKNRMAYSIFLLEIVSDGSIMKGYRTFYGLKREKINSIYCDLLRSLE